MESRAPKIRSISTRSNRDASHDIILARAKRLHINDDLEHNSLYEASYDGNLTENDKNDP